MKTITFAISLLLVSVVAVSEKQDHATVKASNTINHHEQSGRRAQNGPNAGKRMATWRKAHNDMRRKYHVEFGGTFKSVKWNMELKNHAEKWAKEIVKTCVNRTPKSGQNPNDYGVNSAVKTGTRGFQNPITVMKTWEKKLPLGYPKNSVMTQVLWRNTGYVGCADASSAVGAEKTCTAAVCVYAKAGNCAMKRFGFNWTQAVIEGPACSATCPPNLEVC
ncbi:hypothetical protein HJC23_005470 [Cyclotella cryptica]|uniref:SCP domain-containing protein n=1 Tax=Cyclotella cryptica TaxID=29204 RepID=A0ABD3PK61_9STRA|eukprot:CCRYP_013942-RA/>CCRYP_013942-RA protein AED:0.27 eAED:0.27 QI:0/-1/0/1/-1/1/1/0/219